MVHLWFIQQLYAAGVDAHGYIGSTYQLNKNIVIRIFRLFLRLAYTGMPIIFIQYIIIPTLCMKYTDNYISAHRPAIFVTLCRPYYIIITYYYLYIGVNMRHACFIITVD